MRSMSANVSEFEQPALRGFSLQIERVLLNNCRPKIGRNGVHSCCGGRRICRKHGERLWRWKWLRERCLKSGVRVCQAGVFGVNYSFQWTTTISPYRIDSPFLLLRMGRCLIENATR